MGSAFNASLTDAVLYSHVYSQRVDTTRDESGRAGTTDAVNVREHSKMRALPKPDSHLENRCGPKPTVVEATTSVLALELGVGAFDRNGDDDRVVFAANGEVGHVSACLFAPSILAACPRPQLRRTRRSRLRHESWRPFGQPERRVAKT